MRRNGISVRRLIARRRARDRDACDRGVDRLGAHGDGGLYRARFWPWSIANSEAAKAMTFTATGATLRAAPFLAADRQRSASPGRP